MRKIRSEQRLALRLTRLLLELRLELLLLLLQQIDATKTKTHHVCGHHVREHIREAERGHLLVVAASGLAELLETLELRLSLRKISGEGIAAERSAAVCTFIHCQQ